MKRYSAILLCALLSAAAFTSCKPQAREPWPKLAIQSYTFHKFTLMEAMDKCNELGVRYMEAFPGHRLSNAWGNAEFGIGMDEQTIQAVLDSAEAKGVKIVASGVFTSPEQSEWEAFFKLAAKMGMEYVTCEPPKDMWDYIESLSEQYGIKVAVHNHPQPSDYWHPDSLLNCIAERGPQIGSCADVGHWRREGLDQLECLRKLGKRVISYHFKDIVSPMEDGGWQHDTIWGEGILDVPAMVSIMKEQGFDGYLAIEYEFNWDNSVPDIKECIEALRSL